MAARLGNSLTKPHRRTPCLFWTTASLALLWMLGAVGVARAQREPVHYFHRSDLMPGIVAQGQLLRGGPLAGYVQPVELRVPDGSSLAMAVDGRFEVPKPGPLRVGMLIGPAYRI